MFFKTILLITDLSDGPEVNVHKLDSIPELAAPQPLVNELRGGLAVAQIVIPMMFYHRQLCTQHVLRNPSDILG